MVLLRKVGKNLQQARLARDWSQEKLADEAKLDRTYVSQLERGMGNPSLRILSSLASALKVELKDLFV